VSQTDSAATAPCAQNRQPPCIMCVNVQECMLMCMSAHTGIGTCSQAHKSHACACTPLFPLCSSVASKAQPSEKTHLPGRCARWQCEDSGGLLLVLDQVCLQIKQGYTGSTHALCLTCCVFPIWQGRERQGIARPWEVQYVPPSTCMGTHKHAHKQDTHLRPQLQDPSEAGAPPC